MERWSVRPQADGERSKDGLPPPTIAAKQEPIRDKKSAFEDALHCCHSFAALCLGRSANVPETRSMPDSRMYPSS